MDLVNIASIIAIFFGALAIMCAMVGYFIYHMKKKKKSQRKLTAYEEKCSELGADFIFFDRH
ncbi:MAG: hypothetical protein KAG19_05550 [Methylococcales bacterium]|nr:hypothetical protein [Methylococcales bacterium]